MQEKAAGPGSEGEEHEPERERHRSDADRLAEPTDCVVLPTSPLRPAARTASGPRHVTVPTVRDMSVRDMPLRDMPVRDMPMAHGSGVCAMAVGTVTPVETAHDQ